MTATVPVTTKPRQQSVFWRRFRKSGPGKLGALIVALFVLLAIFAPIIKPYDPFTEQNRYNMFRKPPSIMALWDKDVAETYKDPATGKPNIWAAPFGTGDRGVDIFTRVLHGSRISLKVGIVSTILALMLGAVLGLLAGFFGSWIDTVLGYFSDVMLAFPSILLAIGFASIFSDHPPALVAALNKLFALNSPQLVIAMLAVSLVQVPVYLRLTRAVVLSVREREFVQASGALGASQSRILFRHVLPNSLSPLIVQGTLSIATATIEVAALGFLGIGAQPPLPEWGTMISDSRSYYLEAPWMMIFPGLAIFLTVLGFNLLGDGLRDVLDPRSTH